MDELYISKLKQSLKFGKIMSATGQKLRKSKTTFEASRMDKCLKRMEMSEMKKGDKLNEKVR